LWIIGSLLWAVPFLGYAAYSGWHWLSQPSGVLITIGRTPTYLGSEKVIVDRSFLKLQPDRQNLTIDAIAHRFGWSTNPFHDLVPTDGPEKAIVSSAFPITVSVADDVGDPIAFALVPIASMWLVLYAGFWIANGFRSNLSR
jgi:hypothetical protein